MVVDPYASLHRNSRRRKELFSQSDPMRGDASLYHPYQTKADHVSWTPVYYDPNYFQQGLLADDYSTKTTSPQPQPIYWPSKFQSITEPTSTSTTLSSLGLHVIAAPNLQTTAQPTPRPTSVDDDEYGAPLGSIIHVEEKNKIHDGYGLSLGPQMTNNDLLGANRKDRKLVPEKWETFSTPIYYPSERTKKPSWKPLNNHSPTLPIIFSNYSSIKHTSETDTTKTWAVYPNYVESTTQPFLPKFVPLARERIEQTTLSPTFVSTLPPTRFHQVDSTQVTLNPFLRRTTWKPVIQWPNTFATTSRPSIQPRSTIGDDDPMTLESLESRAFITQVTPPTNFRRENAIEASVDKEIKLFHQGNPFLKVTHVTNDDDLPEPNENESRFLHEVLVYTSEKRHDDSVFRFGYQFNPKFDGILMKTAKVRQLQKEIAELKTEIANENLFDSLNREPTPAIRFY